MPRYGDADSVSWFEVETCCVFHIINTFEDGDEVSIFATICILLQQNRHYRTSNMFNCPNGLLYKNYAYI